MGAFDGSLTFKTFFVDGEPAAGFQDDFLVQLQKHRFVQLEPEDEEERRVGWVCPQRPLDTNFTRDKVFLGNYVTFSLRIDRWSIPSVLLKAHVVEAQREYMTKNDLEKLGRREKDEIKDFVTRQLKRKLVPSMKVIDVAWNIDERVVRFWTQSNTVCEEFQEFFDETFGFALVPDAPYTAAVDLDLEDDEIERLVNLSPEWFISQDI